MWTKTWIYAKRRTYFFPFLENQPSFSITFLEILLLGPSPLATKTPVFSPTASFISATSLCVNPGQRRTEWIPSSLINYLHTLTAWFWSLTRTTKSLYLDVSITHLCFSGSASGVCARKTTLNAIFLTSYCNFPLHFLINLNITEVSICFSGISQYFLKRLTFLMLT